jgi:hypothetical protein
MGSDRLFVSSQVTDKLSSQVTAESTSQVTGALDPRAASVARGSPERGQVPDAQSGSEDRRPIHNMWPWSPLGTTRCGGVAGEDTGWRGRIRTFYLLIQRTPDVSADGRCDLSVARTRILPIRRAIRLNMPDRVR